MQTSDHPSARWRFLGSHVSAWALLGVLLLLSGWFGGIAWMLLDVVLRIVGGSGQGCS